MNLPTLLVKIAALSIVVSGCNTEESRQSNFKWEDATLFADVRQEVNVYATSAGGREESPMFGDASTMTVELSLKHEHPVSFACSVTEPSGVGFDLMQRGITIATFQDSTLFGQAVSAAAPKTEVATWPFSQTGLTAVDTGVYVLSPRNPLKCEAAAPVTTTGRTFALSPATTTALIQIELFLVDESGKRTTRFPYGTTHDVFAVFYNHASTDATCGVSNAADAGLQVYSDSAFLGQAVPPDYGLIGLTPRDYVRSFFIADYVIPVGATKVKLIPITLESYRDTDGPPPLKVGKYFIEFRGFDCGELAVKPGVTWFEIVP